MLLVMAGIGGTDILFALDSIPAIFGLTQNVFLVFTATAFSLLGLRQLYFLIDGLLDRLAYLSYWSGRHPRLHRREADPARIAREQRPVHQRGPTGERRRGQHRSVARRHHRRAGRDGDRLAHQPKGSGAEPRVRGPPARDRVPDVRDRPRGTRGRVPEAARRGDPHAPAPRKVPGAHPRGGAAHGAAAEGPRRARGPCGGPTAAAGAPKCRRRRRRGTDAYQPNRLRRGQGEERMPRFRADGEIGEDAVTGSAGRKHRRWTARR